MPEPSAQTWEEMDLLSEISRHHRDFAKIIEIVDWALAEELPPVMYRVALKNIQAIVG